MFLHRGLFLGLSISLLMPVSAQAQSMSDRLPRGDATPPAAPALSPAGAAPFLTAADTTWSNNYRLGPGDVIGLNVFGAEEYSGEVIVLQDGTINLPRVGRVAVQGLTFQGASDAIAAAYSTYIRNPLITLSPVTLRPVRIAVSGEVNRPGSYTIDATAENQALDFPSLTQAIAQAGGITARANLKEVEIRRPIGPNQKQTTKINLWDLVRAGNLDQDVVLQSGDEVFIPVATALTPQELTELGSASFAPDSIKVYVAGEVEKPGLVEVPLNTPLNQALLVAGGFNNRANRSTVSLVRLNPDGSVTQRDVAVDFNQGINEANNPILMEEDVIVVNRSGVAAFGENTSLFLSPFTQILNAIFGFGRLF
jgi:polysaccharide biosynthesis/export protein